MALATYSDLKSTALARMARGDVTDVMLSDYVRLAEADFNLSLKKLRKMLGKTTITTSGGTANLPVDFQAVSEFSFQSRPFSIEKVDLGDLTHDPVRPYKYALGDKMYFGDSSLPATLDLYYYKKIPALTNDNPTNWLLTDYPQVYLDAVLYHGFTDKRNTEEADKYFQKSSNNITRLTAANSDELSGQTMRINTYW